MSYYYIMIQILNQIYPNKIGRSKMPICINFRIIVTFKSFAFIFTPEINK